MKKRIHAKTIKLVIDVFLFFFCGLGKIFFETFKIFFKPKPVYEPKTIMILNYDGSKIGDQVLATALIQPLKKKFPSAKIFFCCSYLTQPIFENNPLIDKTIVAQFVDFKAFLNLLKFNELRSLKPDIAISMSINLSSHIMAFLSGAKMRIGWDHKSKGFVLTHPIPYYKENEKKEHEVFKHLKLLLPLGIKVKNPKVEVFASDNARKKISEMLPKNKKIVAVHGGSINFPFKNWPAKNFSTVIERITDEKTHVFLVGSKTESKIVEKIISGINQKKREFVFNFAGKTNIDELIALLEKTNVFFGIDSAPMHLAAATNCIVYAVFIHSPPIWFCPLTEKQHVFYKGNGLIVTDLKKQKHPSIKEVLMQFKKDKVLF